LRTLRKRKNVLTTVWLKVNISLEIEELRKRIDKVDLELLKLLKERTKLVSEILEVKKKLGLPFKDVKREKEILERVKAKAVELSLDPALTEDIFKRIIGLSMSFYRDISIAYLGPKGSFTEIAAMKFLNGANVRYIPKPTIREVFRSVESGDVDMGVVPIENSIEGSVNITLDLLLDTPLKIYGEVELRVDHCLLVSPGSTIEDIRVIFSHPQAIAQCRAFLETVIPHAEIVEVNSTSKAAEIVRNLRGAAAIASEHTASIYGLEVLAKSIQDYHDNYTRFIVLSLNEHPPTGFDKTSLIFSVPNKPGALYNALEPFALKNVNLTKIESRPTRGKPWDYVFYMDMEGHKLDGNVKEAISELEARASFLKVLGSYPIARRGS